MPHADLAARVSKLSLAEVTEAHEEEEYESIAASRDASDDGEHVEGEEDDSDNQLATEMAPDPSGNGALEEPTRQKPVKKSARFASPSMIEQHHEEREPEEGDTKKTFSKPKGSVFVKKTEAFDFHGEELTEDDAAALADMEKEDESPPEDGATTHDQQQCALFSQMKHALPSRELFTTSVLLRLPQKCSTTHFLFADVTAAAFVSNHLDVMQDARP